MGSARGWIFENESDCLSFIESGGSLIDHRTTTNHGAGHGDDGEAEMEKAIKIAQIQKRPKNISTNKFAAKQRK